MLFREELLATMGAGALVLLAGQFTWRHFIRSLRRAGIQLQFVWHVKIPGRDQGRPSQRSRLGERRTDLPNRARRHSKLASMVAALTRLI